jgi:uroporphyrinogen decarboxylase
MAEKLGVAVGLMPHFGGQVLAEDDRTVLTRNAWGAIVRSSKVGQSISQYLDFGVRSRQDFARYKGRWDPASPGRYPADWEERKGRWKVRDYPVCAWTYGWYGLLRELMGVEGLSIALHEDEALVDEVCEFWADFLVRVFERALREVEVDYVLFWEDMAFKTGPLLSPTHFRRYFSPHYRRLIERFRRSGVRLFMVDSDGNIERLIPLWIETGINILAPFEVDAGMDVTRVRRTYGKDLAIVGGMDKRQLALGQREIEAEVMRRLAGMGDTGYIATLDHAPIPEIPYANYLRYRRFLLDAVEGPGQPSRPGSSQDSVAGVRQDPVSS